MRRRSPRWETLGRNRVYYLVDEARGLDVVVRPAGPLRWSLTFSGDNGVITESEHDSLADAKHEGERLLAEEVTRGDDSHARTRAPDSATRPAGPS